MAITERSKRTREYKREVNRSKKMKEEKIEKKILKAFDKLNNKNCYAFLDDEDSSTRQNLLDFCTLLEKGLEKKFGKAKKYSKTDVFEYLTSIFSRTTERQAKTLEALNRFLKKNEGEGFKFKGLFKGKSWEDACDEGTYVEYY